MIDVLESASWLHVNIQMSSKDHLISMIYDDVVDDDVSESVNVDILDLLRAFFVALSKNCARLSGHPRHFLSSHDFCANIWNIFWLNLKYTSKYIISKTYLKCLNNPLQFLSFIPSEIGICNFIFSFSNFWGGKRAS